MVDNEESLLDITDLVMIDPVGTGFSHAVGKAKDKDFWGVDQDIDSFARFVVQYVTDNGRWNSPKYLIGESYGTMRSAGLVEPSAGARGTWRSTAWCCSRCVDLETDITIPGNDLGYEMFLPTYAAIAWYHHLIPDAADARRVPRPGARSSPLGPYATALAKGDALPDAESARR